MPDDFEFGGGSLKSRHPYNKAAQEMLRSVPDDLSRDCLAGSILETVVGGGWALPHSNDTSGTQEAG
ncbi:unnamed protein product [Boreogadus saida]